MKGNEKKSIKVVHRCTDDALKSILKEQKITPKKLNEKSIIDKILDDSREVVWVSYGYPHLINWILSGMVQYRKTAKAYVVFECNNTVKPNRFKRVFSSLIFFRSQLVIVGDADLKNKIVRVKYKGVIYKTKEDIQELINTINNQ